MQLWLWIPFLSFQSQRNISPKQTKKHKQANKKKKTTSNEKNFCQYIST